MTASQPKVVLLQAAVLCDSSTGIGDMSFEACHDTHLAVEEAVYKCVSWSPACWQCAKRVSLPGQPLMLLSVRYCCITGPTKLFMMLVVQPCKIRSLCLAAVSAARATLIPAHHVGAPLGGAAAASSADFAFVSFGLISFLAPDYLLLWGMHMALPIACLEFPSPWL